MKFIHSFLLFHICIWKLPIVCCKLYSVTLNKYFITLCMVYECVYGFDMFDNGTLHLLKRVFNFKTVVFRRS